MQTPICDFVKKYNKSRACRLHMPGHKGSHRLGFEHLDITEIDGADCLYNASGIIKESTLNASQLFGANTFYSTEGSSHAIRAMLFLALKHAATHGLSKTIAVGRNAHKSLVSACAILDVKVDWIYPEKDDSYLSCNITAEHLERFLDSKPTLPFAVYITTPDYLGNTVDIKSLSLVCKKRKVLLLVDNAHGAYLKFLENSLHPIDCGADMCCDSAHKTLSCLTGGAYLHLSKSCDKELVNQAQTALSLFGTTSPSYLILQSLDGLNAYLADGYREKLKNTITAVELVKNNLINHGYTLVGKEPLKITLSTKQYGYTGYEVNEYLKKYNIFSEFYDQDYIVFMLSVELKKKNLFTLEKALKTLPKKDSVYIEPPILTPKEIGLSFNDALFSPSENLPVDDAKGRILSSVAVSCPPAVPIVVCGEIIDQNAIECFKYCGIESCDVVKR